MKASEFRALIKEEVRKVLKEALAPADKSKLTNKVEITVAIARTLMNNAKTGKLKHMSAPGGITHYWNPKTKEYIGRTEQEGRLNKGTFFFSDALDKAGNLTEGINESSMSDIDQMAQDSSTFNEFALKFFKEYPNIQKDEKMGFIKWLKIVYSESKKSK
jgi:hypothetical protein